LSKPNEFGAIGRNLLRRRLAAVKMNVNAASQMLAALDDCDQAKWHEFAQRAYTQLRDVLDAANDNPPAIDITEDRAVP
jgi:hypothetical protein